MTFFESINNAMLDFPHIILYSKDLNYVPHIHAEMEIILMQSGTIDITCDNSCFTAAEGDICIFMPGEIHSFASQAPNSLHIIKLHCKNSVEQTDFSTLRMQSNPIKKDSALYNQLKTLILQLIDETSAKKRGYGYMAHSLSQLLLCTLLRSGELIKLPAETKKKRLFHITLLEKVNTYISLHYTEQVTLGDISAFCSMSEYYFAHAFKNATNTTFYHYLTAYRLDKAITLLSYSEKKITDIALECGFSNTRSFNRAFKNFFHKTPTEYMSARC